MTWAPRPTACNTHVLTAALPWIPVCGAETGYDDVGTIRLEKTSVCRQRWKRSVNHAQSNSSDCLSPESELVKWAEIVFVIFQEKVCPQNNTSMRKDSAIYPMCADGHTVHSVWAWVTVEWKTASYRVVGQASGDENISVHLNRKLLKCWEMQNSEFLWEGL